MPIPPRKAAQDLAPPGVRRIIEQGPDVLFRLRLTPRLKLEFVNRAVLALTGYPPEDWYADPALASRVVHRDDLRRIRDPSALVARAQPVVVRLIRRSGALAWAEAYVVPVYGRQGSLVAVEGIARDITTVRAPAAASEGSNLPAVALREAPSGVALVAPGGRMVFVNRRFSEMLGYAREELEAKRFQDITHPSDLAGDAELLERLMSGDLGRFTFEKRYVHKNGTDVWARLTAGLVRGESGEVRCAMGIIDPIAEPLRHGTMPAALEYLDITVHLDRLAVTCGGQPVIATPREVLLLRYFIQHRGEILSRDQLLQNVWGYSFTGGSRTVDVHVSRLRQKLPPLAGSLVTIGNVGYTLQK